MEIVDRVSLPCGAMDALRRARLDADVFAALTATFALLPDIPAAAPARHRVETIG